MRTKRKPIIFPRGFSLERARSGAQRSLMCAAHTQFRSTSSACDNNICFLSSKRRNIFFSMQYLRIFAWPIVKRCISIVNCTYAMPFMSHGLCLRRLNSQMCQRTHRQTSSSIDFIMLSIVLQKKIYKYITWPNELESEIDGSASERR